MIFSLLNANEVPTESAVKAGNSQTDDRSLVSRDVPTGGVRGEGGGLVL